MKKLKLSIILILVSFSSFSQSVTLSEKQAKAVAKDIISGQACKEELDKTQSILELTETKVKLKDKVILNLEDQKSELLSIDLLRIDQLESKDKIIALKEKEITKKNRTSTFYKIVALAGVIGSGYLLIK